MASKRGRVWLVVAGVLLVCLFGCVGFVLVQPSSFRIARTAEIDAPPARVAEELTDLRRFIAWDPSFGSPARGGTRHFSPTSGGVGAWFEHRSPEGNSRVTIVSITDEEVVMRNDLSGGLAGPGSSIQRFTLRPIPSGTEVTWSFENENGLLGRALWPFVGLEARIAPDMEASLRRLDAAARAP